MNSNDNGRVLLCTFWLDDLLLGIDVRDVQEIIRSADITPIPHSPPAVAGLINLRGQIATTIDLRDRLGVVPSSDDEDVPSHVVVRSGGEQVSLLVDRIGEVLEVGAELYEPPPVTMRHEVADLIVGTYKLTDELLLVVDVPRLVDVAAATTEDAA